MILANCTTDRNHNETSKIWILSQRLHQRLHLHTEKGSKKCEFCDQTLPPERIARLAEHFSAEDQKLKTEIEALQGEIDTIRAATLGIALPDRAALYSELREEFDAALAQFKSTRETLIEALDEGYKALLEKLTSRTISYSKEIGYDPSSFQSATSAVISILERQDAKTSAFDAERAKAVEAIEKHYLSTIAAEVTTLNAKIEVERTVEKNLTSGSPDLPDPRSMADLEASISAKQAKVSSAHTGGAELTELLKKFLGRSELRFESTGEGYHVLRRDKPAKRLSEGEKTAIAFTHFIVKLGDQDFDRKEGIVVIDDPVSSLDASASYQAYSFLKNAVKDSKQIFILTHNFEFLKLLLPWAQRGFRKNARYYMIVCAEKDQTRDATIRPLDDLLIKHASEYQYLFKVLHQFESDGTIISCYNIPNMARKLLETFLEFFVPSNNDTYNQLEAVKFDPHKKAAIYKFTNDHSHATGKGFDPALVSETQKNTKFLLEMIEAVAPDHYAGLVKLST